MAELLYKTLGGVTPKGKPRVYFACHGEDFRGCFQEITDEILKISSCAIYYYEQEPEQDEDYYLNLSQMQLIVMPVTSRLLHMPNRAMDVEFPYAVAHHIPVLPLMQEQGLEQRYQEKFGDLQFLDKYNSDLTAIPYAEKLNNYLNGVLMGDELAERVRAAFDAYVFLSYRKKDRKYAQELMHLIHRNPRCRDIAIWYDEFLTPGENFNDSIRDALEKSGLFLLTVTPNLVNEINYIMTTEYPMAKNAGKPILPARMQPTDPDALRSSYDGIPDAVDPQDEGVLTDAVLAALRNLALGENDTDPTHNFLLGIAYLSGIDVEVDHEYAVKLITGAAEAGLTEAMEKLVSMYESGEGVQRDYMTAISWREKLVERSYDEMFRGEEYVYIYLTRLLDLGDAWIGLRDLKKAKAAYEKMHNMSQWTAVIFRSRRGLRCVSRCYIRLGDIAEEENDLASAKKWYLKGQDIFEVLAFGSETQTQIDLSNSYDKLGDISRAENDLASAKKWYMKGLEIRKVLAKNGTPKTQRVLGISYDHLGDISKAENDLASAKRWYMQGLAIWEALAQSGTPGSRRDLSVSYEKLGDISKAENDLVSAKKWYMQGLEIWEVLAQNSTPKAQRDLSVSYNKLGDISRAENDQVSAKKWYMKGLAIREALAKRGTPESRRDLSVSYERLGNISMAENDLVSAKKWYMKGLAIWEALAQSGTPGSRRDLSVSYEKLGDISKAENDLVSAKKWYMRGMEIREVLAKRGTPESRRDLGISYDKLGDISKAENDLISAKKWYMKGMDMWGVLAQNGTAQARRDLCISYERMGDIGKAEKNITSIVQWYRKSMRIREVLAKSCRTVQNYEELAVAYYTVGYLENDVNILQKALDIFQMLAKEHSQISRFAMHAKVVDDAIRRLLGYTNT